MGWFNNELFYLKKWYLKNFEYKSGLKVSESGQIESNSISLFTTTADLSKQFRFSIQGDVNTMNADMIYALWVVAITSLRPHFPRKISREH